MPRYIGPETVQDAALTPEHIPLGSRQELILVVEDDASVRRTTVDTLRDLGYSVVHATAALKRYANSTSTLPRSCWSPTSGCPE